LTVRSLVAPAVVDGATFRLVFTVANRGGRTAPQGKIHAFLSQDTLRGRGDVRLAVKAIPPLAAGSRVRETGTAKIPRSTSAGEWFLIVCATAGRDANSRNDCRRSSRHTTVWNYPDAWNTGPTGSLRESTGDITVSRAGTVIANRKINGCITIRADNVTIRNSEINCDGKTGIANWSRNRGLLVEDTEIECGHEPGQTGISDSNFTVRRSELFGCENIIWAERNVAIMDSYIHDPIPCCGAAQPHTDSVQTPSGGSNIVIRHNRIYGGYLSGANFGNAAITASASPGTAVTSMVVDNNLLAGGGYTLYCPGADGGFTWTNNRFSRIYVSKIGGFGPVYGTCALHTNSGNVYHETGKPLKLR
jgi:hypothetical protein